MTNTRETYRPHPYLRLSPDIAPCSPRKETSCRGRMNEPQGTLQSPPLALPEREAPSSFVQFELGERPPYARKPPQEAFTTDVRPTCVQLSQRSWGEQQEGNKVSRFLRPVNVKTLVVHVPSNMFAREACNFCLEIQYRSKTIKMLFRS